MAESLPFDEFIRFLNGGYYLDTFQVGSVKIDPISWPTSARERKTKPKPEKQSDIVDEILNRPWIDREKFAGSGLENAPADVEGKAIKKMGSDLPPIRKVIKIPCARNQTQNLKKEEDCSCKVQKIMKKVSVSNIRENMDSEEERKLEGTKRKLREQYELIENEKKKRRIQIIDFQKLQPSSPVKKQQKKKAVQVQRFRSTKKLPPLHLTNPIC